MSRDRRNIAFYAAAALVIVMVFSACKKPTTTTTITEGSTPKPGANSGGVTATSSPKTSSSPSKKTSPLPSPSPLPVKGSPLAPDALRPADPGRYTFDETGIRKLGCAPDEKPATPTTLDADPADTDRQQSVRDQRYPSDGHGTVSSSVLEFRKDGVYLAHLRQEQTFPLLGGPFVTEFEPSPPVLVFPADPKAGQTWSFTLKSKDGKVTVESSNTLESVSDAVPLGGGATIAAMKVRGTSHITGQSQLGPLDITDRTVTWISVQARLIVKTIADTSGTAGTCRFDGTHIEAVVRSTTPAPR